MPDFDDEVRALLETNQLESATTRIIEHYGPELLGFLCGISGSDDAGAEAYALACENIWLNLDKFRFEASLRTWTYRIARNALHRLHRDPRRRPANNLPESLVRSIEQARRSPTEPYRRTDVKEAFRALRGSLDPLDHEILILRLDRDMSWKDIARAIVEDGDTSTVDQRAAAYRKRYERVKTQLRELAVMQGLIERDDD